MFSERQFEVNNPLGFFVGEEVWISELVGGTKPSDAFLDRHGVGSTPYDLSYLDKDCKMRVVRPKPLGMPGEELQSLFMGMHYLNNACETYEDRSMRDKAVKLNNTLIIEDGLVIAIKKILPDQELFTGYFEGDHNLRHREEVGGGKGGKAGGEKSGAAKKPAGKKDGKSGKKAGKGKSGGGKATHMKRKLPTSAGRKAPVKPQKIRRS